MSNPYTSALETLGAVFTYSYGITASYITAGVEGVARFLVGQAISEIPIVGDFLDAALDPDSQTAVDALVRQGKTGQANPDNARQLADLMAEGNQNIGPQPQLSSGTDSIQNQQLYHVYRYDYGTPQFTQTADFYTTTPDQFSVPTKLTGEYDDNGKYIGGHLDWYYTGGPSGTLSTLPDKQNLVTPHGDGSDKTNFSQPIAVGGIASDHSAEIFSNSSTAAATGNFGDINVDASGNFNYNVNPDITLPIGSHSIDYFTIINLKESSNPGTLAIALNRAPIVFDVNAQVVSGGSINIDAAHGLLRGAFDPDGDQVRVSAVGNITIPTSAAIDGTYGHLIVNSDGSLSYYQDYNFQKSNSSGNPLHDEFKFTVSDGFGGTAVADLVIDISASHNPNILPVSSSLSLGFKLSEANFDFTGIHTKMSGLDVNMLDISTAGKLIFSDGTVSLISSNALISNLFYDAKNPDVWSSHLDPASHYDQYGWHEGRDPDALFSTYGYLAANQDVAKAGINPLSHYDANGWKEGRDPSANFDNELYLLHNPDVKAAGIDPLAHYLQSGQAEGRQAYAAIGNAASFTHGSFDAEYYLLANPDVAKAALASGGDTFSFAFQHYEANGWHEGRLADAYFDPAYYLAHNPDVAAAHIDPLTHYDQSGWKEGRDPSAAFHTNAYLAANPDVAAAHIDPLTHYLQHGADEGRHLA